MKIAQGLREFSFSPEVQETGKKLYEFEDIHRFLDKFSTSRIGIRMLIGQYLDFDNEDPDYIGLISVNTSPLKSRIKRLIMRLTCVRGNSVMPQASVYVEGKI